MVSFGGMYIVLSTPTSTSRSIPFKKRIHLKIMPAAPDFLLLGLSSPKTFILRNMPYTLTFCTEPKAKLQNPSSKRSPLPSGSGEPVVDDEWGTRKNSFHHPSSSISSTLSLGRRFPLHSWGIGFCNSGQALRAEWHGSEVIEWKKKTCSLKFSVKNRTIWTALVLYQKQKSIKNQCM